MNILMMTNTFTPHVGGVARSVSFFADELRKLGHHVMVVAPEFDNQPENEDDVVRIPAIQKFNGSDFSVILPIPGFLASELEEFQPDLVHSHHPFLIGSTAIRVAHQYDIPLVFTHHTMYEQYTHYVPVDSPRMKRFAIELSVGYCNLCDRVIAPSKSVAEILRNRGVKTPIDCIPTGVYTKEFAEGDRMAWRRKLDISSRELVIGHLGRLAPEKNLPFLSEAVARFLKEHGKGHFLVVGKGPSEKNIRETFEREGLADRLHMVGSLAGQDLVNAYHAMDIFAFASKSETQGMVLTEAMAAGAPVAALDAPGAREVVRDGYNGVLLETESVENYVEGLKRMVKMLRRNRKKYREAARETAEDFSMQRCAERLNDAYDQVFLKKVLERDRDPGFWRESVDQFKAEWQIWKNVADAAATAFQGEKSANEVET